MVSNASVGDIIAGNYEGNRGFTEWKIYRCNGLVGFCDRYSFYVALLKYISL